MGSSSSTKARDHGRFNAEEFTQLEQTWVRVHGGTPAEAAKVFAACTGPALEQLFAVPGCDFFARRLVALVFFPGGAGKGGNKVGFDAFRDGVERCVKNERAGLEIIFGACGASRAAGAGGGGGGGAALDRAGAERVFEVLFRLSGMAKADATRGGKLLGAAWVESKHKTDLAGLRAWARTQALWADRVLSAWARGRCVTAPGTEVPRHAFGSPRVMKPEAGRRLLVKPEHFYALALADSAMQGTWKLLYDSDADGMSFNRLGHHVLGYKGPTLLVCQDMSGAVFGGFAPVPWDEDNDFFGTPTCFLFRCAPTFRIYRVGPIASNYMWFNQRGFSRPHGIGFGGKEGDFRLFLNEDFDACKTSMSGYTYDPGPLAVDGPGGEVGGVFELEAVQLFGFGGVDALRAQAQERASDQAMRDKIRKVDKSQLLDGFTREHMLGKTFAHAKQRNR